MRVTPVPLYNTFEEVWDFVDAFRRALLIGGRVKDTINGEKV
jgi:kynureninase